VSVFHYFSGFPAGLPLEQARKLPDFGRFLSYAELNPSKGNLISRLPRFALASVAAASLLVAPGLFAAPAYATTIDVAGATFDFGNPVDTIIGESAGIGDEFYYTNVTTVGGVSIDAVVTLVGASMSSIGNFSDYEDLSAANISDLNLTDSNAVDVVGCYTNAAYALTQAFGYDGDPYDFTQFVSGDLIAGQHVEYLDEFYDDPAYEGAINTGVDLCGSPTTGSVQIRVEFEVAGDPVTLNNLSIYAGDIDSLQSMTLFDPKPTTWSVSPSTELEVVVDGDSVAFNSPDENSFEDDPTALNFVGEARYDGVASITYKFALEDAGGGSLSFKFASYFNPDGNLAETGVDAAPVGIAGLAVLGLGSAIVVARRIRRNIA
jgi:hypothetical protein